METPISSPVGDANSQGAGAGPGETDGSSMKKVEDDESFYVMRGYPNATSYIEAKQKEHFSKYSSKVRPKLLHILESDSFAKFEQLCGGWWFLMGRRDLIHPEVLVSIVSKNALRCARAALQGGGLFRGRRADPNGRHRYGIAPLHMAAETFSVDMLKLLLRHGASANLRTQGDHVIEGLLPLHVAVENASMHKFLEDHWEDGHPLDNLISLLCLPEMKMYLDTTRLIAKHTDNIIDEVWNYINDGKLIQLAILLLAAQKQLCDPINGGRSKATLNGFYMLRLRTFEAVGSLHRQVIAMTNAGKNGAALKKLKNKKEALITSENLVGIVHNAGEALERYIQTHPEVPHEEILENVSSILNSNGVAPSGKGIDTGNLKCYQYSVPTLSDTSASRVDTGEPNEADTTSSVNTEGNNKILWKAPPKGLAIKDVRNKFFPYWKSVLSARMQVYIVPPCELSMKDRKCMQGTKPNKGVHGLNKSGGNVTMISLPQSAIRYEWRRQLCTIALASLKLLRRT